MTGRNGLGDRQRRVLIRAAGLLPLAGLGRAAAQNLPRTPACDKPGRTQPQTEGPYFTPRSPRRDNLVESGSAAPRLIVAGRVISPGCRPVAGALLDFWHCDERGEYDNAGFRYRGHLFSTADGRYRLETILPGVYPGRTRHIHVKVQAPGRPVLTTQLYFPDEPANRSDGIYRPELEIRLAAGKGTREADFTFVLDA